MKSLDGGFEVKNFIYDFFKGNHSIESKIIKYGIISLRKFQVEQAEVISRLFRSSHQRCSLRKVFLEISQNSQGNICARDSFLIKLQASGIRPVTLLKKSLWHRCFSVNFAKFLRTPFRKEHL